jgi:hypothetical protein
MSIHPHDAQQRLWLSCPVPGLLTAQLVGKGPNAEIGIMRDERVSRQAPQLPERVLEKKDKQKSIFYICGHSGVMCSGRGKYITSTDNSPPSTGLFPIIPEYNSARILNFLILYRYE